MLAAVDVYYKSDFAKAVGILFNWQDEDPLQLFEETMNGIAEYVPGEFYKRELPCILKLLKKITLENLEAIIVDGYVYLDDDKTYGLGAHLWQALDGKIPVIGVAKTKFHNNSNTVYEIRRGKSNKPLFISAIGINCQDAANCVKKMAGINRIPDILKKLDTQTKLF
jgi:deoxyribonuclease V